MTEIRRNHYSKSRGKEEERERKKRREERKKNKESYKLTVVYIQSSQLLRMSTIDIVH